MCVKDELDIRTLLLKLPHSGDIEHREIKLGLIQKFYLYLLVFIMLEGTVNTAEGEKHQHHLPVNTWKLQ